MACRRCEVWLIPFPCGILSSRLNVVPLARHAKKGWRVFKLGRTIKNTAFLGVGFAGGVVWSIILLNNWIIVYVPFIVCFVVWFLILHDAIDGDA